MFRTTVKKRLLINAISVVQSILIMQVMLIAHEPRDKQDSDDQGNDECYRNLHGFHSGIMTSK
ncbi:MAG: hypothetical protein QM764_20970 [Chitinophagaceae bacterium]